MKTEQLTSILDSGDSEGELCKFLKENPWVLMHSLNYFGHPTRIIPEFPLGTEFRADFLVIAPFSGAMELRLIEVEPPKEKIFNKDGSLAKRANKALEQVNSWRTYIKKNRQQFLRDLQRYANEKDIIRDHDPKDRLTCTAGLGIYDPRMTIYESYEIIMGRRDALSWEHLEKKAEFKNNNDVYITTTDRLLQGTERMDQHPEIYE